jgi:hypothetical protein
MVYRRGPVKSVIRIRRYEGEVERRRLFNKRMLQGRVSQFPIVAVLGRGYDTAVIQQISVIFYSMCVACCWMLEVRSEIFMEFYIIYTNIENL